MNEIANVTNYPQLGHILGIASVHLNAIEHYPDYECNQRLVEAWFKSDPKPRWETLHIALNKLKREISGKRSQNMELI